MAGSGPPTPVRPTAMPFGVALAVVLLAALISHAPVLRNGFVSWDDDLFITRYADPISNAVDARGLAFYPVFHASLRLDRALWGVNATAHHAEDLALHAATAALLFLLLRRLLADRDGRPADTAALLAALLFAVHPINTEAVAWASGRKIQLAGLFALGAWLCRTGPRNKNVWVRLAVPMLFAAACLSNALVIALPLLFIAQDILLSRHKVLRTVLRNLDTLAVAAVTTFLRATMVTVERDAAIPLPPAERITATLQGVAESMGALLAPVHLMNRYPLLRGEGAGRTIALLGAALIVLSVGLILRTRRRHPRAAFCIAWFWLALLPSMAHAVHRADRHVYLAAMGVFALAGMALGPPLRHRSLPRAAASAIVLCLGAFAWQQDTVWRSARSLWSHTLRCAPRFWLPHANLANACLREGLGPAALEHAARAAALRPKDPERLFNLATILWELRQLPAARRAYERALELDPQYATAHANLGMLLAETGDTAGAESHYRAALEVDPNMARVHFNLGMLFAARGETEEAEAQFRMCLRTLPAFVPARIELANALIRRGRADEASRELEQAGKDIPDSLELHANLANAFARVGRFGEAARHAAFAARLADQQGRKAEAAELGARARRFASELK